MRLLILLAFALTAALSAPAQQGTADAIVVKIPAANIPSSVTLSASQVNGLPGKTASVPIVLAPGSTVAPGTFQFDIVFDASKLTFLSANGLSATPVTAGDVRLASPVVNPAGYAAGSVGAVTFTLAGSFSKSTPLNLANCMSADPSGVPLSTGCTAGAVGLFTCAVTGDATVSVADVQAMLAQAIGIAAPSNDMNQDGVVNVLDIQKVLTAAIGGSCLY